MSRAFRLARKGGGWCSPNPRVGAVLIDETETVLAEGYHRRFGAPHAEVACLQAAAAAGIDPAGLTLVVSLEPCCHQGKTPPCVDALIAARLNRVVYSVRDPNPRVAGGGHRRLQEAGIEVVTGVGEAEGRRLIAGFLSHMEQGRPHVLLKWAMTLDGRIATRTGDARWISGPEARQEVHRLRGQLDAILVGIETALADDPLLTCRLDDPPGPQPLRIVLDSQGRLPLDSQLVQTAREVALLVATGLPPESGERRRQLEAAGAEVRAFPGPDGRVDVAALLQHLSTRERPILSLLVEGGGRVHGSFLDRGLADRVCVYLAPKLVGAGPAPIQGGGVRLMVEAHSLEIDAVRTVGEDVCLEGAFRHLRESG